MKQLHEAKELSVMYHLQQELLPLEVTVKKVVEPHQEYYQLAWSDTYKSFSGSFAIEAFHTSGPNDDLHTCHLVVKNLAVGSTSLNAKFIMTNTSLIETTTDAEVEANSLMIKRSVAYKCVQAFFRAADDEFTGLRQAAVLQHMLATDKLVDDICQLLTDKTLGVDIASKKNAPELRRRLSSRHVEVVNEYSSHDLVYFLLRVS